MVPRMSEKAPLERAEKVEDRRDFWKRSQMRSPSGSTSKIQCPRWTKFGHGRLDVQNLTPEMAEKDVEGTVNLELVEKA